MVAGLLAAVVLTTGPVAMATAPAAPASHVDSTVDEVDAAPGDGRCATAAGACTLRAAIQEANAGGARRVDLPAGTYPLLLHGYEQEAARGDLDVSADLILRGAGARRTVIEAFSERVLDIRAGARVGISGVTIQGGSVDGVGGGIATAGDLTIARSTIRWNSAFGDGGGIYASGGAVTVLRSTVTGNLAGNSGGGIAGFGAVVRVINSTVSRNTVPEMFGADRGSGIRLAGDGARLRLQFATVAGNEAVEGAAVDVGSGATGSARASIVVGGSNPACASPLTTAGGNVDDDGTCGFSSAADRGDVDALLGPLASNGGPTDTHAVGRASPAVDLVTGPCPAVDQRLRPRPRDGDGDGTAVCDAGAFERR